MYETHLQRNERVTVIALVQPCGASLCCSVGHNTTGGGSVFKCGLPADQPPWVRLALFLIQAEASNDAVWGSYLEDFAATSPKPVTLWSQEGLNELQGTQVLETAMQYKCAFSMQVSQGCVH